MFYTGSCAPRPDRVYLKKMTKENATLNVLTAFIEKFPDCDIVVTYHGKIGAIFRFMITVGEPREDGYIDDSDFGR